MRADEAAPRAGEAPDRQTTVALPDPGARLWRGRRRCGEVVRRGGEDVAEVEARRWRHWLWCAGLGGCRGAVS